MFAPYQRYPIPTRPRPEDPEDVRLGAFVRAVHEPRSDSIKQIKDHHFVIVGYPDDRGVDRNGGRLGAADAPHEIRRQLYNMTPDPKGNQDLVIWDFGDLRTWSMSLNEAHEEARKFIREVRETKARVISLGGGHDWAFPDFVDFKDRLLNLDAHLDMRPLTQDAAQSAHSGTPFRKLLGQRRDASLFYALGLQKHCNSRAHLEWARSLRANMIFLEELPWSLDDQWKLIRDQFRLEAQSGSWALSIDLDVFAQSLAPGVSAPQACGLDPRIAIKLLETLGSQTRHLGVYELNPQYDQDGQTSRLAARLIHHFLHSTHSGE